MTTGYHCSVWDGFSTKSIEGSGGDEEGVGQDGEGRTWAVFGPQGDGRSRAGVWTSERWTDLRSCWVSRGGRCGGVAECVKG